MFDCPIPAGVPMPELGTVEGGEVSASAVVNRQVELHGMGSSDMIAGDFQHLLTANGLVPEDTIGLMTAANVSAYHDCLFLMSSGAWVHVVGNRRSVECPLRSGRCRC